MCDDLDKGLKDSFFKLCLFLFKLHKLSHSVDCRRVWRVRYVILGVCAGLDDLGVPGEAARVGGGGRRVRAGGRGGAAAVGVHRAGAAVARLGRGALGGRAGPRAREARRAAAAPPPGGNALRVCELLPNYILKS